MLFNFFNFVILFCIFGCLSSVLAWDYIAFAQQWVQGVCRDLKDKKPSTNCNIPVEDKWTIHGIWPSNRNYDNQQCEHNQNFETNRLQSIQNDLNVYWASIHGSNPGFWKHEWNKHGKCGGSVPGLDTMLSYFKQGLSWNKQYDIARILHHSKIVPSNSKPIPVSSISEAVRSATGGKPKIRCAKNDILTEIYLCFDENLRIIDCYGQPNCRKEVYYLRTWRNVEDEDNHLNEPVTTHHESSAMPTFLGFFLLFIPLLSFLLLNRLLK